jgi:formamidopyrimidine-DNA glycosylase
VPELPDVETFRRYAKSKALHQRIERIHMESPKLLKGTSTQGLGRALKGRTFESTRRHGKYLLLALDSGGWLVLHFGMSGELRYFKERRDTPAYTRLLISFENGHHLAYVAPRKLGRISLADTPQALIDEQELGPDALGLTDSQFLELAAAHRGGAKPWLMDQQTMAGIGNIYSDEILFQAGIHPGTVVSKMDKADLRRLFKAMRSVLRDAIAVRADPERMPAGFLLPHRRQGGLCPKCGSALAKARSGGRTAWYCPTCQKRRGH